MRDVQRHWHVTSVSADIHSRGQDRLGRHPQDAVVAGGRNRCLQSAPGLRRERQFVRDRQSRHVVRLRFRPSDIRIPAQRI